MRKRDRLRQRCTPLCPPCGLAGATAFAAVMVLAKLAADVVTHTLEHRWIAQQPVRHSVVGPGGADH